MLYVYNFVRLFPRRVARRLWRWKLHRHIEKQNNSGVQSLVLLKSDLCNAVVDYDHLIDWLFSAGYKMTAMHLLAVCFPSVWGRKLN